MALFRNNNKKTVAELEDYYSKRQTKSTFMAWVMAFLSLIITIASIAILFYGGRWVYRTVTDDSDENQEAETSQTVSDPFEDNSGLEVQGESNTSSTDGQSSTSSSDGESNASSSDEQSSSSESNSSEQSVQGGVVSNEAASTSESNEDRVASSSNTGQNVAGTSTSEAGKETTETLTDTGPGETLFAVLFASVFLGYFGSLKLQTVKNK